MAEHNLKDHPTPFKITTKDDVNKTLKKQNRET